MATELPKQQELIDNWFQTNQPDVINPEVVSEDPTPKKKGVSLIEEIITDIARSSVNTPILEETFLTPTEFGQSKYDKDIKFADQLYDLNEFRAQQQSGIDKIGNTVAKFAGFATNVVGGVAGLPAGIIEGGYKAYKEVSEGNRLGENSTGDRAKNLVNGFFYGFSNNVVYETMSNLQEKVNETFPHYYSKAEREMGFLDQLGTYNFWGDKAVNGIGFVAAAILTEGASAAMYGGMFASRVAAGSKLAAEASRAATLSKSIAEGVASVNRGSRAATILRQIGTGAGFESSLEAREVYDNIIEGYLVNGKDVNGAPIVDRFKGRGELSRQEKLELLSEEERRELHKQAMSMQNAAFAANMFLVGTSNMVLLGNLYGAGITSRIKSAAGAVTDPVSGAIGKGLTRAKTFVKADKLLTEGVKRNIGVGSAWAARGLYEGFEEGSQGFVNRLATNYAEMSSLTNEGFVNTTGDFIRASADAVEDVLFTTEGQTEIFLGALLGLSGVPSALGGRGIVWTPELQDAKQKTLDIASLNKFQQDNIEQIKELTKNNPNVGKGMILNMVAIANIDKRTSAMQQAVNEGDLATAKSLEMDNALDLFIVQDLMGSFSGLIKEFNTNLELKGSEFKAAFGYSEDMTDAQIADRKIQLRNSFETSVKNYKDAVEAVDKVYSLPTEMKHRNIANHKSPAFKRKVMIHAAMSANDRDSREKSMLAELAKEFGGSIVSEDGLVDTITISTPDGPRVIPMGTMNAFVTKSPDGKTTYSTVESQIIEVSDRLQRLEGIPKKARHKDHDKVVSDLEALFNVLKLETNGKKSVSSLFLETGNLSEAKTLDEWVAKDPLNIQDRPKVERLLSDLRRLRGERHEFATLFQRLTTEEGQKEMDNKLEELATKLAKAREVVKTTADEKTALENRKREFINKIKLFQNSLSETIEDIKSSSDRILAQIESNTALIEELEPWVTAVEKAKRRSKPVKTVSNPQTKERVDIKTAEEFKAFHNELVANIAELQEELVANEKKIEDWIPQSEILIEDLNAFLGKGAVDPANYEKYITNTDKVAAMELLIKELNLPHAFTAEGFMPYTKENQDVQFALVDAIESIERERVYLQEMLDEAKAGLSDLSAQADKIKAFIDLAGEFEEKEFGWEKELQELRDLIADLEKSVEANAERKKNLETAYAKVKKVQTYMLIMDWDETTAHKRAALPNIEEALIEALSQSLKTTSDLKDDEKFKPDYQDGGMQNVFFKTAGNHTESLKTYRELYAKKDRTEEEEKDFKNAESQVVWYDWLARGKNGVKGDSMASPVSQFTKLMMVTKKSLASSAFPLELKAALENSFYDDEEIKVVAIHISTEPSGKPNVPNREFYTPVKHGDKFVFTTVMLPWIEDKNKKARFTNKGRKDGDPLTPVEIENLRVEFQAWRNKVLSNEVPTIVSISGVLNGEIVPLKGKPAIYAASEAITPVHLETIKLSVVTSKGDMERERKAVQISAAVRNGIPASGKISAKLGDVVAYNPNTGKLVLAHRQKIGENTAKNLSKLFQYYLLKYNEGIAAKMSPDKAREAARQTPLKGKNGYSVPLWDYIEDIVMTVPEGSAFTLTSKIIKGKMHILYGNSEKDVAFTIGAEDFQDNNPNYKAFLEFLKTKYHQVKHSTVENSTQEDSTTKTTKVKGKPVKTTYWNGKYKAKTKWQEFTINDSLDKIEATEHDNYTSYLLKKGKDGPALLFAHSYKPTPVAPMIHGGGLYFGNNPDLTQPKESHEFRKMTYLAPTKEAKSLLSEEEAIIAKAMALEKAEADIAAMNAMQQAGKEPSEEDSQATEPPITEDGERNSVDLAEKFKAPVVEEAVSDGITIEMVNSSPKENFITEEIDGGVHIAYYILRGNKFLDIPDEKIEIGRGTSPLDFSYENFETSKGGVVSKEVRTYVTELMAPFLSLSQVNDAEMETILNNIDAETAKVLTMTPLEITSVQHLIGTMDRKAVAQLTGFGKVLYSHFAPGGALYHEAFHNISLYILSPEDSRILYSKVREIPGTIKTYLGETKKLSELSDKEAEEWLAEEFRHWLLDPSYKIAKDSVKDTRSRIRKFFDAIKSFLRVRLGLNENFEFDPKMNSIEGLFKAIEGGKFLKAGRHSAKRNTEVYNMLSQESEEAKEKVSVRVKIDLLDTFLSYIGKMVDSEKTTHSWVDLFVGMTVPEEQERVTRIYRAAYVEMRSDLKKQEAALLEAVNGKERPIEEVVPYTTAQPFISDKREYTPENITSLKPNEVFVFGANTVGGHGGGTAGLAQRGKTTSNYQALPLRTKGKWSEYGVVDKLMQGTEGKSFGIVTKSATIQGTVLKIGGKRSVPLIRIEQSINKLIETANKNPDLKFLVTKFGTNMAGFSEKEMKSLLENKTLPDNIILPKEFEVRPTSSPVLGKPVESKEQPSELALNYRKLDAVQNYLTIVGRNNDSQKGDPKFILSLANEHFKDMKFVVLDEEQAESYNTTKDSSYDRDVHSRSASDVAESTTKLLLGTIPSPHTNTTTLPGVYPLSLGNITHGKEAGTLRMVQNWTINTNSFAEVRSILESKVSEYPWVGTLLDRIESIRNQEIGTKVVDGFDLNKAASERMLISLGAQFNKALQPPLSVLVQDRPAEGVSSNSVAVINLNKEKAAQKIANDWNRNLQEVAKKGEFDYVKLDGNNFVFNPKAKLPNTALSIPAIASSTASMSMREAVNLLKVVGIEFSAPTNIPGYISNEDPTNLEVELLRELRDSVEAIFTAMSKENTPINIFSRATSDIATRARFIVNIELEYGNVLREDSSYLLGKMDFAVSEGNFITSIANVWEENADGEVTKSLSSLPQLNPLVVPYSRNSLTVENQTGKLKVYRSVAIQEAKQGAKGKKTTKSGKAELLSQKIAAIHAGYTALPQAADKNTVLVVDLNIWDNVEGLVSSNGRVTIDSAMSFLLTYLEDEVLASVVGKKELPNIKDYSTIGDKKGLIEKLRIFEGLVGDEGNAFVASILKDKKKSAKIYGEFKKTGESATLTKALNSKKDLFDAEIRKALALSRVKLQNQLTKSKMLSPAITISGQSEFIFKGIDSSKFTGKLGAKATNQIDQDSLNIALDDINLRQLIGNVESFKVFLGDPAFYGALFKRTGGGVGPKTMGSIDMQSIAFYGDDAIAKNWVTTDGKFRGLQVTEPVYKREGFSMEGLAEEIARLYDEPVDMADGAIFVRPEMYRFLQAMTNQWELAQERVYQNIKTGTYTPIKGGTYYPAKLQYFGPAYKSPLTEGEKDYIVPAFLKTAVFEIDKSMVPTNKLEYPNLNAMIDLMERSEAGMLVLPSAFKVGGAMDHVLPTTDLDQQGKLSFHMKDDVLQADAITTFSIEYMGTQVKGSADAKPEMTSPTQVKSHVVSGIFENGQISEEVFPDPVRRAEVAADVEEYNTLINEMTKKNVKELLKSLNIPSYMGADGNLKYSIDAESYKKILDILTREGENKQIGAPLMVGLDAAKEKGSFKLEHFVDSTRMEKLLYSHMEMKVIKPNYAGSQLVATPSLPYEHTTIDGVYVDESLKLGPDKITGKYTMEIYLPHHFKEFFGENLEITNEGIINPKTGKLMENTSGLLDMLAVRIPTDGLHSVEVIRVKDFLPHLAGPRIVVPALLVKKAGSDFDVDKLSVFFQSFKVINGDLVREIYYEDEQSWFEGNQAQAVKVLESAKEIFRNLSVEKAISTSLAEIFVRKSANLDSVTEEIAEDIEEAKKRMEKAEEALHTFFYRSMEDGSLTKRDYIDWKYENPDKTIWDLNSSGALQNRLMEVMTRLIQAPERVNSLMTPVSIPTLTEASKLILEKQNANGNIHNIPDLNKLAGFLHDRLGVVSQTEIGHAYWSGKDVTGISAQNATHIIKGQLVGLKLVPNLIFPKGVSRAMELKFRLEEFAGLDKDAPIELGRIKGLGENAQELSAIQSEVVNGAVDTVNTPVLHILNMGPDAASAGIGMIRAGANPYTTFFFLNQPIVRMFLDEIAITRGTIYKTFTEKSLRLKEDDIENILIAKVSLTPEGTPTKVVAADDVFFTQEQLIDMIGVPFEKMTEEQRGYQIQIINDMRAYLAYGDVLSELVNLQAFDTKPPRGKWDVRLHAKLYNDLLDKGYFINAEKITDSDGLFLKEYKNFSYSAPDILEDLYESTGYGELYNEVMELALEEISRDEAFLSQDDMLDALEQIDADFTTFVLQRVAVENGMSVGKNAQRLLYGSNSIANRISEIQRNPTHPLTDNYYINQMLAFVKGSEVPILNIPGVTGKELPPDHLEVSTKGLTESDNKLLVEAFYEIVDYDNETGGRLHQDLLETALLQSGVSVSPYSFLHTIPGDIYAEKVSEIFGEFNGNHAKLFPSGHTHQFDRRFLVLNTILLNRTSNDLVAEDNKYNRGNVSYTVSWKKLSEASVSGAAQYSSNLVLTIKEQGKNDVSHSISAPQTQHPFFLNFTGESMSTGREVSDAPSVPKKTC